MARIMSGSVSYYAGLAAEEAVSRDYLARGLPITRSRWRGRSGEIDLVAREVSLNHTLLDFSATEFEVLALLASNAGVVLNRDTVLRAVRGIDYDGIDRSVDIAVSRLRRKLADDAQPARRIKTVRNKGYLFVADAWG